MNGNHTIKGSRHCTTTYGELLVSDFMPVLLCIHRSPAQWDSHLSHYQHPRLKHRERTDKRRSSIRHRLAIFYKSDISLFPHMPCLFLYTLPSHSPSSSSFVTFCSLPCFFCFQFSKVKRFKCEIICIILRLFRRMTEIYVPLLGVCVWL